MRKDGPPKLGKSDNHKSKIIDLDELKDKASTLKDKNKQKIRNKDKSFNLPKREKSHKLGKDNQTNILTEYTDKLKCIPWIKHKKSIIGILIIILIVAIGVLAADNPQTTSNKTNNTNNTSTIVENHYDNGLISFDYPKGWNVTNGTESPVIVTVSKDENNSFVVSNENLDNSTFSQRILEWRQNILQIGDITYESNITIDNSTGYNVEATYKINNTPYNLRGIAVSKDNTIYFIMFIFDGSLLDYKDEMDQVINSFYIK